MLLQPNNLFVATCGRLFKVEALATSEQEANSWLTANPQCGVLLVDRPPVIELGTLMAGAEIIYMANMDDHGKPI